jgi:hypothetical protein
VTFVTAFALAACDSQGNTNVQNGSADPMANEAANAGPIEMPAPIVLSKKYRCADNAVVSLDWREKDNQPTAANLRVADATVPTELLLGEEGKPPYTAADGTELTGTKEASSVRL